MGLSSLDTSTGHNDSPRAQQRGEANCPYINVGEKEATNYFQKGCRPLTGEEGEGIGGGPPSQKTLEPMDIGKRLDKGT